MIPLETTALNIQRWASFLKQIRSYLDTLGFFEVSTPNLVTVGAFESSIDPLQVLSHFGRSELHTSPEIEMKSILSETSLPIYQICKCYRDELESTTHSREFSMLEFYEPGTHYEHAADLVSQLVSLLAGRPIGFKRLRIPELFQNMLGIDLVTLSSETDFRSFLERHRIVETAEDDTWEDMYFRVMLEKIEPALDCDVPTFLFDYPIRVSPLSKAKSDGFAERFELYWKNMELCNGCTELREGKELKSRYKIESLLRERQGKMPHPFPEKLLQATDRLPETAGVAIGLDRLFRCLYVV